MVEQSGIELFAPGDDRMKAAVPRQRKAHAVTAGGSNDNVVDRRPAGHSVGAKAQGLQLPQGTGRQAVAADLVAGKGRLVDEGDPSAGPGQGDGG